MRAVQTSFNCFRDFEHVILDLASNSLLGLERNKRNNYKIRVEFGTDETPDYHTMRAVQLPMF